MLPLSPRLSPPPARGRRRRTGRLLVEALVSLALAAASATGVLGVLGSALALSDAAAHAMLAAGSGREGAALALRAPCRLANEVADRSVTPTHASRRIVIGGTMSQVWVHDRWVVAGAGGHRTRTSSVRIGVRCE